MTERWPQEQCAEHCGIKPGTWRDYVADGRAPAAVGYDPVTGRKVWDADAVRHWHAHRGGQGARTDLTYLPATDGRQVYLSPNLIACADLLRALSEQRDRVERDALRNRWVEEFPEDTGTRPLSPAAINRRADRQTANPRLRRHGLRGDGKLATGGTIAAKRIKDALAGLEHLGAIRREGDQVLITDRALLTRIAAL